ncbi:MAG: hypothetical protein AAGF95_28485 [Chloroflexota bacterium]
MHGFTRQLTIVCALFSMIVFNLFSLPIMRLATGVEPREFSTYYDFPTAISPAVYTFTIWAPIFMGCVALAIYQALPSKRNDQRLNMLAWPIILSCFSNALTPYMPIGISVVVVALLLLALAWAFLTVHKMGPQDRRFYWFVQFPITIFFAWITVATIVNTSQWLVSLNWSGFGVAATTWSAVLIGVATVIGLFISLRYREMAYGLVLVWAFWGIVAAQMGSLTIIGAASAGTLALLITTGWLLLSGKSSNNRIESSAT